MSGAKYLATRSAGRGLLDAEALDDCWIAPEKQLSCQPPIKRLVLVRLITSQSRSANMPPHASFVGAELSIIVALNSADVEAFPRLIRERVARLSYRSVRGSPKCGKTLVSPNQVIADIRSPSSVRTNNAYARAISACALGR